MTIQAKSSKSAVYLLNRYGIADAARIRVTTQILGSMATSASKQPASSSAQKKVDAQQKR